MKRTPILTIWVLSFAMMILFANIMNIVFWLSFVAFASTSVYIEKHSKRIEKDNN